MEKTTDILEKLFPSIINLLLIHIISTVVTNIFSIEDLDNVKLVFILLMLLYNLSIAIFNKNRCVGMIAMNTYWDKEYSIKNRIIYSLLYTLSFSTVLFHIRFPFDLLLSNLLFIQLPFIIFKKTTAHAYLSGDMRSVRKV